MKLFSHFIPVLSLLFLLPLQGQAQQVFQLNSIDTQAKQAPVQTISGKTQQRVYYTLNETLLSESRIQKGDQITVQTAPASDTRLIIDRVENYTNKTTTFIARDAQQKENSFTFTYANGRLNGVFHKSHEDIFFFEYDSQTQQNYVAKGTSYYDDDKFCSVHEAEQNATAAVHSGIRKKTAVTSHPVSHIPSVSSMASTLEDEITVDIMIPYSKKAADWAAQSNFNLIDEVISQAMGLSQAALDNSGINITLRLVHFYQTDYDEDSTEQLDDTDPDYVSSGDHLRRVTRNPALPFELCPNDDEECSEEDYDGYMEAAHSLRQEYGADLVAAVLSEPNTGGIAWRNSRTAGNPVYGFSINRVQQIASGTTLIHEIGHNMGNAHARNQPESPAGGFGGIYVYSTGNRFSVENDNYATVMAYTNGGYQSIPYFSSPDISFLETTIGHPLSYTGSAGPSDNVRSMRESKRVIASYLPSITDPPVVDADVASISVKLDQENSTASIPISITNNGESDLMWDLDFDIESSIVAKQKRGENIKELKPISMEIPESSGNQFAGLAEDETIFSAGFEPLEGFETGDHTAITGWRSFSTDIPFEISDENPSEGSNHLRLAYQAGGSESYARSPSFGLQPFGEFSVSFDMALENTVGSSSQRFDVYIYDGNTSTISSGLVISNSDNSDGSIYAWNLNEVGQEVFSPTGSNIPQNGTYQNIEIRYNPNNKSVDYYLNGSQIASNQYTFGRKPDYFYFRQSNHEPEAVLDIDNIEVERLHTPFNWLSAEKTGGVVSPSSSQTLELNLTANNVETGTYETILLLHSNDPENPTLEIPITADIERVTSGEISETRPEKVALAQNYPNPFNPFTTIQYTLSQSTDVVLNVYNIVGQKVATLLNETMPGGTHKFTFDASGLSSGVYIYRLQTPSETLTRQMVLIK